jgi:hypothetical protein
VGPQGPTGPTGPGFSGNLQDVCIEGGRKAAMFWGTCAQVDVKNGIDAKIYIP